MIELRPEWCADADRVPEGVTLGAWRETHSDKALDDFDADDWQVGTSLVLTRETAVDERGLRRALGLSSLVSVGIAVRWYCRAANLAGVHGGGPQPLVAPEIGVVLPGHIAGAVELETNLVVTAGGPDDPPVGSVIWSDAWSDDHGLGSRLLVVEGDEFRLPVVLIDFDRLPAPCRAGLWHVRIEAEATAEDLAANVIALELNQRIISNSFGDSTANIPSQLLQAMRVDLLRQVCNRFLREEEPDSADEETIGALAHNVALQIAGSWEGAKHLLEESPAEFETALWSIFSEEAW